MSDRFLTSGRPAGKFSRTIPRKARGRPPEPCSTSAVLRGPSRTGTRGPRSGGLARAGRERQLGVDGGDLHRLALTAASSAAVDASSGEGENRTPDLGIMSRVLTPALPPDPVIAACFWPSVAVTGGGPGE